MGATIPCKFCHEDCSKSQIFLHEANCEKAEIAKKKVIICEICSQKFPQKEFYSHVLSHYKDDSPKETDKEKSNPTISFCEYNFASNKKIQRVSRIG